MAENERTTKIGGHAAVDRFTDIGNSGGQRG